MPVSMSTVDLGELHAARAGRTTDPSAHSPSTEIGSVPISLHASFHASPFDGLPFDVDAAVLGDERRRLDAERRRHLREQRVERLARRPRESPASPTPPSCCRPTRR